MSKPRILLVEDSATQGAFLRGILEGNDWQVSIADTAEKAMELVGSYEPHVLIADYHLPGMQGDELCRQLRMRIETRTLPIIMITADDTEGTEERVFDSGADDFIVKSYNPEHLVHRIRNILRQTGSGRAILLSAENFVRQAHVLAVEDSATYLAYLQRELSREPYELETCSSGAAALARLEEKCFDCAVVDMMMPDTDGLTLCREIHARAQQKGARPMILMLTAREDLEALRQALDFGADDFVRKSTNPAVLKARIRALLRRKFHDEGNERILELLADREIRAQKALLEKEAAEARAALVDQLERSNRELEEFVGVAAHDLKSPIRTIGSLAQLVGRRIAPVPFHDSGEVVRDLDRIVGTALRMGHVLDDLLDYSRLATSTPPTRVDLNEVLACTCENLRAEIDAAGARVEWRDLPVVQGVESEFLRLFQNLVSNGIKFRGAEPPLVEIQAWQDDERLRLCVRDNGIGIDACHHEAVFTPFKRLHSGETYPGTGIGLATCRRIVERWRGKIWIESPPNGGTSVHFALSKALRAPEGALAP